MVNLRRLSVRHFPSTFLVAHFSEPALSNTGCEMSRLNVLPMRRVEKRGESKHRSRRSRSPRGHESFKYHLEERASNLFNSAPPKSLAAFRCGKEETTKDMGGGTWGWSCSARFRPMPFYPSRGNHRPSPVG